MNKVPPQRTSDPLQLIREALVNLNYGEIVISIHDGEIVQIARTEKMRPHKPQ